MKKTITALTLCAFGSISHAQDVTTLTTDEKDHFVLTIPAIEFETEDGKQAFSAKLYSSTAATFEVDFESVQKVALQDNDSDNDFPIALGNKFTDAIPRWDSIRLF